MSGHNVEEDWFLNDPVGAREFHVMVDGLEVATATGMPYVYSPLGFGNSNANTACHGPGTSSTGDTVHPVLYWTAQQAADAVGVHGGVGEIPAARVSIDPSLLPLLTGARNVSVVITNGGSYWVTSVAFVLS